MPIPDFVVKTGDQAIFNPTFPPAIVNVLPGVITGSVAALIDQTPACVLGDEASVIVPSCMYISGSFVIPGFGTLTIAALAPDQIAAHTTFMGKPAIMRGTLFTALFTVNIPAQMPVVGGTVPDPLPMYSGNGQFITSNVRFAGS